MTRERKKRGAGPRAEGEDGETTLCSVGQTTVDETRRERRPAPRAPRPASLFRFFEPTLDERTRHAHVQFAIHHLVRDGPALPDQSRVRERALDRGFVREHRQRSISNART